MVVVDRGRAFDFLTWYRPLTVSAITVDKPTLELLRQASWKRARAGTCSPLHFKRMALEKLGAVPIDPSKLRRCFPVMAPGTSAAIEDVSIANALNVRSAHPAVRPAQPVITILGLEQILSD